MLRENVVPRPQWAGGAVDPAMRGLVDGGMLGWTPHGVGWRENVVPSHPQWAGGAVGPAMRGLVDGGI